MNLLQMLVGHPIIHIYPDMSKNPVIGFAERYLDPSRDGKNVYLTVKDYVSGQKVDVQLAGTMMFTKQRYNIVRCVGPTAFVPMIHSRGTNTVFESKTYWSDLVIHSQLEINKFWEELEKYENGSNIESPES